MEEYIVCHTEAVWEDFALKIKKTQSDTIFNNDKWIHITPLESAWLFKELNNVCHIHHFIVQG